MTVESGHVKGTIEDSQLVVEAETHHLSSISFLSSSFSRSSLEIDISDNNGSPREPKSPDCTPQGSMSSTSPPIGINDHALQMQSPQIQTMGHPPGYDPDRIPSSVFSSKVANASDWSVTSNESLFSIHVGNGSLSRELWKSGELSRMEERDNLQSESKYNELSSLPPVVEEVSQKCSNASAVDTNVVPGPTTHRISNDSDRSNISFAFPVLVNDGGNSRPLEGVEEKAEESQPQLQSQDSKRPQRLSVGRWCSWLSCSPRCC